MSARRKGRELAVQMLYQWDMTKQPLMEIYESMTDLQKAGEAAGSFARELVRGTVASANAIDERIASLAEHWRMERMSTVDRNILRLAVYECLETETPKRVVINEALEVAKRFSSAEAVQFINGVLDAVCTGSEAASESR